MNWKEFISLGAGIITVLAALFLGATGQLPWDVALPILLSGLAVLGIHPSINTTPTA